MTKKSILPTKAEVKKFEMLNDLLDSCYDEIRQLSIKKPDEALNEFKINRINRVLGSVKDFLINQPTAEFLELLDKDNVPSNSDAILIIGQFTASMKHFHSEFKTAWGDWNTKD